MSNYWRDLRPENEKLVSFWLFFLAAFGYLMMLVFR